MGERLNNKRRAFVTGITATALVVLAIWLRVNIQNGGEPGPGYYMIRNFVIPANIVIIVGLAVAIGSFVAAGYLKTRPTKLIKFNQMRRFALIVAGIPGVILFPMVFSVVLSSAIPKASTLLGLLMISSIVLLMPAIAAMFIFLILAVIAIHQEPADPETPRPKPHLLQISLAAISASLLPFAFMNMQLTVDDCNPTCSPWFDETTIICGSIYAAIWLALAVIWRKGKKPSLR